MLDAERRLSDQRSSASGQRSSRGLAARIRSGRAPFLLWSGGTPVHCPLSLSSAVVGRDLAPLFSRQWLSLGACNSAREEVTGRQGAH